MKQLSNDERELVERIIGTIIDIPSLYMGGPSKLSLKKAGEIVNYLIKSQRLISTNCAHNSWKREIHGIVCPECSIIVVDDYADIE